jgi:hypothetical protein
MEETRIIGSSSSPEEDDEINVISRLLISGGTTFRGQELMERVENVTRLSRRYQFNTETAAAYVVKLERNSLDPAEVLKLHKSRLADEVMGTDATGVDAGFLAQLKQLAPDVYAATALQARMNFMSPKTQLEYINMAKALQKNNRLRNVIRDFGIAPGPRTMHLLNTSEPIYLFAVKERILFYAKNYLCVIKVITVPDRQGRFVQGRVVKFQHICHDAYVLQDAAAEAGVKAFKRAGM